MLRVTTRGAHLVEVIFEAEDVAECFAVGGVSSEEWHEEVFLLGVAFKALQDDVERSIRVEIEATCAERERERLQPRSTNDVTMT